ncbi:phage terminase large subunit [Xanthobacter sp. YC-JY1]|uniref:phage terminase large subunit n=1 Tax=Xanthobacter sp. YC-JY1 TaxID=2419844 RepID=UPI001F02A30E|nr:phage terminase large subunit [Xanthobacter sp. YC-JY1]UJX45746.1 DNA maturase B [Xanthobacter sp. YC-JY1]
MTSLKKHLLGTTSKTNPDPLKADFRNFLWLVWQHLNLPEPTPVQYDIAHFLQHGPRRLVIEAFRGVGKSWVTSAFVCWLLYCNPQMKILVVSASKQRADDFSTFTLRLIRELDVLRFLEPRPDQRESKVAFDVGPAKPDHAPSVKSVGITGQIAGSRADVIVADDIEVPNNSATQALRDKLAEAVKEFDAVLKPGGRVIYLGTPQSEQSIYNILPERGYVVRIWPARYPTEEKREKYGAKLAPFISNALDKDPSLAGFPTDIRRFTHDDLLEREASYGRSGFALQFQLDTSLSDADRYPLKLADLIVYPLDTYRGPTDLVWASGPQQVLDQLPNVGLAGDRYHQPAWTSGAFAEWEGAAMFVDPSGRGKDETSYAVVKVLHGRMFLTAAGGFRGGYDEDTLTALMMIARRQQVNVVLAEPNYGGGMFTALLKSVSQKVYPVKVEDADWSSSQKEARIISTLEPVMNQHRLVVCPSVVEGDFRSTDAYEPDAQRDCRLFYQMTRITPDRGALAHDDRLDALAGAVAYWAKVMARDTEKAALSHKESIFDRELERFMAHALGRPADRERWSSSVMQRR